MRKVFVFFLAFTLVMLTSCSGTNENSPGLVELTSVPPVTTETSVGAETQADLPLESCKKIALVIIDGANSDIHTVCPDGSNLVNLTNDWSFDSDPAWSVDGKWIAYASSENGAPSQILIMDENGMYPQQLTSDYINDMPAWLPDGSGVAFRTTNGEETWWWRTVDLVSHKVEDYSYHSYDSFFQTPSWSPDGSYLAYMSLVEQTERNDGSSQIHIKNLVDGSDTALTQDTWANINPRFSKDGTRLAFLSERDGSYNIFAFYTINLDGSDLQRVTDPAFPASTTYSWSPDGRQFVLGYDWNPPGIYLLDIASGELKELMKVPQGQQASSPDWQP